MDMPIPFIKDKEFEEKVSKSKRLVLVWFTVPRCVPCKKMEPRILPLFYSHKKNMDFYRLDIQAYPKIAQEFNILNTPVLVFFKDGKEIDRQDWLPTGEEILNAINRNI